MGCVSSRKVQTQNTGVKDERENTRRKKEDKNESHGIDRQAYQVKTGPSGSKEITLRHQKKLRDNEVEADIREYDKWQLHLAENDRLSMVQHSHRELSQPFYYPPPEVRRPRTSAELQQQQAHSEEIPKTTFLKMTTSSQVSAGGGRRKSLLEESDQVGTSIRRESATKSSIYELLCRDKYRQPSVARY